MIRRPPRSTPLYSSAASDVYKRQLDYLVVGPWKDPNGFSFPKTRKFGDSGRMPLLFSGLRAVSYTHLRAHETVLDLVCRLLLEKKKKTKQTKKKQHTTTT